MTVPWGVITDQLGLSGFEPIKMEVKYGSQQKRILDRTGSHLQTNYYDNKTELSASYYNNAGTHGLTRGGTTNNWIIDDYSEPEDAEGHKQLNVTAHKNA